eukprot:IDg20534t1
MGAQSVWTKATEGTRYRYAGKQLMDTQSTQSKETMPPATQATTPRAHSNAKLNNLVGLSGTLSRRPVSSSCLVVLSRCPVSLSCLVDLFRPISASHLVVPVSSSCLVFLSRRPVS